MQIHKDPRLVEDVHSLFDPIFFLVKDWAKFHCNQLGEQTAIA